MIMKLTGQARKDFDKWYSKEYPTELIFSQHNESLFREIPNAFKYGVLVDWFDSVGFEIEVFTGINDLFIWIADYEDGECKTRPEARTSAIEKGDEIYNEQNK